MSTFFVNGKSVTTTRKQSLLRFLRDELKLTSVKTDAVKVPAVPVPLSLTVKPVAPVCLPRTP